MKNTFDTTANTYTLGTLGRILTGLALLTATGCSGDDVGDTGATTSTSTSTTTTGGESTDSESTGESTTTGTASGMSDSDSTTASTEETATESESSTDTDTTGSLCGDGIVDALRPGRARRVALAGRRSRMARRVSWKSETHRWSWFAF